MLLAVSTARSSITLDRSSRTALQDPQWAFVRPTALGFNMHTGPTYGAHVCWSRQSSSDGWALLPAAATLLLRDGMELACAAADVVPAAPDYRCSLPRAERGRGTDAKQVQQQAKRSRDEDAQPPTAVTTVAELAELARRQALLTSQLTAGLSGTEKQAARRRLEAATTAFVRIASTTSEPQQQQHAAKSAAAQLRKVSDDFDKQARRTAKAKEVATTKAASLHRAQHRQRQPGPPRKDRRTFNNRTVIRKDNRVRSDPRRPTR